MNDDIKLGYNIACNGLNEDIDTMIDELHNAYMRQTKEKVKDRLDAQIKILWSFKSRIEDCIAEGIGRQGNDEDIEKGGAEE